MKTEWDYTLVADAYLRRPDYAQEAVDWIIATAGVLPGIRYVIQVLVPLPFVPIPGGYRREAC